MAESAGNRTSNNKQPTASGAEAIFLVFLVAFGMGLGVWVERAFSFVYKEPTEQQFLGTAYIKGKQERLARLESAINEAEKQLDIAELEELKHRAALQSLEKSQPTNPQQGAGVTVFTEARRTTRCSNSLLLNMSDC